jgi:hypothetical protein
MRTKITADGDNYCTIEFENPYGETTRIVARAPNAGGYVRDQNDHQLCARLAYRGDTLTWNGQRPLVDLIRREYRAMRAAERREDARWS